MYIYRKEFKRLFMKNLFSTFGGFRRCSLSFFRMLNFFLCVFYSSHGKSQYKSLQGKTSSKAKQVCQGVWLQGCQGNQENLLQKEAQFT